METFGRKQKQPHKQRSSSFPRPNTAILGTNHHASSFLPLQHTIDNQAVLRPLQTQVGNLKTGLPGTVPRHFGHDFSRVPTHSPAAEGLQTILAINQPGNIYEEEADRLSHEVMN